MTAAYPLDRFADLKAKPPAATARGFEGQGPARRTEGLGSTYGTVTEVDAALQMNFFFFFFLRITRLATVAV